MIVGRTCERLWGAATAWDYLTEENAAASIGFERRPFISRTNFV
jgi:hypothetical protein